MQWCIIFIRVDFFNRFLSRVVENEVCFFYFFKFFILKIRKSTFVCVALSKITCMYHLNLDPSLDTWDFSSPLMSLWINRFYVYLGFAFGISLWICFQIVIRKQVSGIIFYRRVLRY